MDLGGGIGVRYTLAERFQSDIALNFQNHIGGNRNEKDSELL